MLEVIRNHACTQLRFLRGAAIDESVLRDAHGAEGTAGAARDRCLHSARRLMPRTGCAWWCGLATSATPRASSESIRIPRGREVTWGDFEAWFD